MKDEEGWEEEDSLHPVYLQLYPELLAYPCLLYVIEAYHPETSEILGPHLGLDIQEPLSISKIVHILVSVSVSISSFSVSKHRLTSKSSVSRTETLIQRCFYKTWHSFDLINQLFFFMFAFSLGIGLDFCFLSSFSVSVLKLETVYY